MPNTEARGVACVYEQLGASAVPEVGQDSQSMVSPFDYWTWLVAEIIGLTCLVFLACLLLLPILRLAKFFCGKKCIREFLGVSVQKALFSMYRIGLNEHSPDLAGLSKWASSILFYSAFTMWKWLRACQHREVLEAAKSIIAAAQKKQKEHCGKKHS